jgi:hypothetical protein
MPTNKYTFLKISLVLILVALIATPVFAQTQDDFRLGITKTFGFANGDQIRGTFTLYISGSTNIKSVQYLIDGSTIGTITASPFNLTFQTTAYSNGFHDITAIVETTEGKTVTTAARKIEFATADQESSSVGRILIPILAIVVLVVVLGAGAQFFFFRKKFVSMAPGTARNYGFRGGTICPRCHRPYSIHLWAVKLIYYKFDRCDFCGKWALIHPYSMDALRAAEQAEISPDYASAVPAAKTEQEKLREMIDKSKYTDQ